MESVPKDIAAALHISYGTVRWNLANLRKLYGIHSTRELLLIFKSQRSESSSLKISPRDKEVIELFMYGNTYEQIAEYLGISVSGVRRHLEKVILQNELKSTLELFSKY